MTKPTPSLSQAIIIKCKKHVSPHGCYGTLLEYSLPIVYRMLLFFNEVMEFTTLILQLFELVELLSVSVISFVKPTLQIFYGRYTL